MPKEGEKPDGQAYARLVNIDGEVTERDWEEKVGLLVGSSTLRSQRETLRRSRPVAS